MTTDPILILLGRPIGFKALFGENSSGTQNMPLQVQVIYNSCMCPLSYFIVQTNPSDMTIEVFTDAVAKTQPIEKQQDRVR